MRGYLSFILVFSCLMLILSLLGLSYSSRPSSYARAISVERAYGLSMDVKSSIAESLRQGAGQSFSRYDSSHDLPSCSSCPDHGCIPSAGSPYSCDFTRCSRCFREPDARAEAELGAEGALSSLRAHDFDSSFSVSIGSAPIYAFTREDPLRKNGISLDSLALKDDVQINITSAGFSVTAGTKLPKGLVITYEGPAVD